MPSSWPRRIGAAFGVAPGEAPAVLAGFLMFLALFTVVAWRLNAAYWKDIK